MTPIEGDQIPTIWSGEGYSVQDWINLARLLRLTERYATMNIQPNQEGESNERNRSAGQDTDEGTRDDTGRLSESGGSLQAPTSVPRPAEGRREPHGIEWQQGLTDREIEDIESVFGYGFPAAYAGMFQSAYLNPTPYILMPQELADQLTAVCDDATLWFHDHRHVVQVDRPELEPIKDSEVHDRIQGMQYSMDREIARLVPYRYEAAWNWRFDADWRDKHIEWVNAFNAELTKPEFAAQVREKHVYRYDLSSMPWINQYNLCVRWQRIWAEWKDSIGGETGDQHYDPVEADAELTARAKAREEANRRE